MENSDPQTPDWVIRRIQKFRPARYVIIALNSRTGELWEKYDCTIKKYTDDYCKYFQHQAERKGWNVKYYPVIVCAYADYNVKFNQKFLQYLLLSQHPLENIRLNSGYPPAWRSERSPEDDGTGAECGTALPSRCLARSSNSCWQS